MKTYTIEQFKNYLKSQDSLCDIFYNLSEKNIDTANMAVDVDELDKITLEQTCGACPEQYDAHYSVGTPEYDPEIGYLRLRHGSFTVECTISGEIVYSASPDGDGCFTSDERDYYLQEAKKALLKSYYKHK